MDNALQGKVAIVTGASRGIGKGIALELGAAGATVYVTGRSVEPGLLPGTVGATAAEIDELGGRGIAVACDHHDDEQVSALFDRVASDHGRLDVLVNNVFNSPGMVPWLGQSFWELPIEAYDEMTAIGVRSHYVAARAAAAMMVPQRNGTIVNVSSSGAIHYAHNVPYGVGKAAVDRMTVDMALELRAHDVAVMSIWPGLVRTELVMMGATHTDDGRAEIALPGEGTFDLAEAESPRFVGRGVVALVTAADRMNRSGGAYPVSDLASDYGFTDVDGTLPRTLLRPNE